MKVLHLTLLATALLACSTVLVLKLPPAHVDTSSKMMGLNEEVNHWRDRIQSVGPHAAHQELMSEIASQTTSDQHNVAHEFGHALYEEVGVEGMAVCGMEFNGGCTHEFVGTAIANEGTGILERLHDICVARLGVTGAVTCEHGFGHGLVAYLGYRDQDMASALDLCATIPSVNPIHGCYGGVFMESNSRTMINTGVREFTHTELLTQCEQLGDAYKPACYFWSALWMLESIYGTARTTNEFAGVGAYCSQLPTAYASYCFQGLGYYAPPSAGFKYDETRALCDAVSTLPADRASCWMEAVEAVDLESSK